MLLYNSLAIDCTTQLYFVALQSGKKVFFEREVSNKNVATNVLPMVKMCLIRSNLTLDDLDFLILNQGPGYFTGIRIASGIIQGFSYGLGIPVISISSLLILAQGMYRRFRFKRILVAVDAKSSKVYFARYEFINKCWSGEYTEILASPEEVLMEVRKLKKSWIAVGNAWKKYFLLKNVNLKKIFFKEMSLSYNFMEMFSLARLYYQKGKLLDSEKAIPVYLNNLNFL